MKSSIRFLETNRSGSKATIEEVKISSPLPTQSIILHKIFH
uniref:Uncharacterized protein n=1 Tax=Rhizophora mucronata TaxID=61149 RepID=A0A2P2IWN8_RHIMU